VLANRNVPNGVRPILSVIGELPAGTAAAYEAAFGWGWLLELLEGYGFEPHMARPLQCKAIASARLKNDKVDAATLAQLLRAEMSRVRYDLLVTAIGFDSLWWLPLFTEWPRQVTAE
jgi:transposase